MSTQQRWLFETPLVQAQSISPLDHGSSLARQQDLASWGFELEALYYTPPVITMPSLSIQKWTDALPLPDAVKQGKGKYGVYIIERNGKPVYGGKAGGGKGDLAQRMKKRLEYARQSGDDLNTLRIRLGIVSNSKTHGLKLQLEAIERIVVRTLKKIGYNVVNIPLTKPFNVGAGGIDLQPVLPSHKTYQSSHLGTNQRLKLNPGATWER